MPAIYILHNSALYICPNLCVRCLLYIAIIYHIIESSKQSIHRRTTT
nr:MAG TPA: hypothetical protein [Caudoviricetes sp.]